MDFTITTPTNAIGPNTPSRAITLTVTGGSLGSDASFALTDGGLGGTFYPASPAAITAGNTTVDFAYTAPIGSSGSVTIQAVASGGITTTQTLSLTIADNATIAIYDSFTGTAGTSLSAHTPDIGGSWHPTSQGSLPLSLDGSGNVYCNGGGHDFIIYYNSTTPTTANDFDLQVTTVVQTVGLSFAGLLAQTVPTGALYGYNLEVGSTEVTFLRYYNNSAIGFYGGGTATTSSYLLRIAVRLLNAHQYLFAFVNDVLVNVSQDDNLENRNQGILGEVASGQTSTAGNSALWQNLYLKNADWTLPVPTLYLTGPSTGYDGLPSTNFTVHELYLASTTVITPHDGGAGGTFIPTTVTLTSGSPSATFTYTAPSASTFTISITNDQSITNPSTISYVASIPPVIVTFPNSNIFLSPMVFRYPGDGSIVLATGGGYMKGVVSGTTQILFHVDTTINSQSSGNMPSFKVLIDDSPYYFAQMGVSDTQTVIASGLTTGSHTYEINFIGGNQNSGDSWSGTAAQTKINSVQFDPGAIISPPTLRSKRAFIMGDSYLLSYFGNPQTGAYYTYIDFTQAWPATVAYGMDFEYGVQGVGSCGWTHSGNGGFPAGPSWWDHYDSTHPRDMSVEPDYLFASWGINDHGVSDATLESVIGSWLTAVRAVWSHVQVFLIIPVGGDDGQHRTAITTAVTNFGDPNVFAIDVGTELAPAIPFSGGATYVCADALHPYPYFHGWFGAKITDQIKAALPGKGIKRNNTFGGF